MRAYSILEIKSLDEEERRISGIATTPNPDREGDIVEPLGVTFKNPVPLLWQHKHDFPIGHSFFEPPQKTHVGFTAKISRIEEDGPLKAAVDMAWQAVKAQLVRGVSIGFRAIERSVMENGGSRFLKSEVMELSLVTIPANMDATIETIKSLDSAPTAGLQLISPARSGSISLINCAARAKSLAQKG